MALTENTMTGEEFAAAIDANPDILTVVKGTLAQREYVVQDKTEHQSFLTNHENVVSQKITKNHAEQLEKDVLEMTGIAKSDANEKYYDYFKRATGEKLQSVTKLEGELKTLKEGHNPSAADKARIIELETAIATKTTELTDKLTAKENEIQTIKVGSQMNTDLATIRSKYKAGLDPEMIKLVEESVVGNIMKSVSVQEDGTITVLKEDGTVKLNPSTFKAVTVAEELSGKLASLIDTGKVQTGTGTQGNNGDAGTGKKEFTGLPSTVDSKVKLDIYLKELGYLADTEEYNKIFDEHSKGLKLR